MVPKVINNPRAQVIRVPKEYAGEYVAYRSWLSKEIVAHSKDPAKAYENARHKGVREPVLMFIRDPNMVYVY